MAGPVAAEPDALSRRAALEAHAAETSGCTRCRLAQGRTQVVYGIGDPDADLMFVGEAPGFHEDQQGVPFVGPPNRSWERWQVDLDGGEYRVVTRPGVHTVYAVLGIFNEALQSFEPVLMGIRRRVPVS